MQVFIRNQHVWTLLLVKLLYQLLISLVEIGLPFRVRILRHLFLDSVHTVILMLIHLVVNSRNHFDLPSLRAYTNLVTYGINSYPIQHYSVCLWAASIEIKVLSATADIDIAGSLTNAASKLGKFRRLVAFSWISRRYALCFRQCLQSPHLICHSHYLSAWTIHGNSVSNGSGSCKTARSCVISHALMVAKISTA